MNRILLTAAAALSMAVSSQAMAASYVIESFTDANGFDGTGGLSQTSSGFGAYLRDAEFVANQEASWVYFGDTAQDGDRLQIGNESDGTTDLTLTYDISSLGAGLGSTGNSALSFTVYHADGLAGNNLVITALLNGQSFGTWSNPEPIISSSPSTWSTQSFVFANSALTGTDELTFQISSLDGVDVQIGALTIGNVSPVPEASEWAMMVAGLGVVGAVAGRRRARISA